MKNILRRLFYWLYKDLISNLGCVVRMAESDRKLVEPDEWEKIIKIEICHSLARKIMEDNLLVVEKENNLVEGCTVYRFNILVLKKSFHGPKTL